MTKRIMRLDRPFIAQLNPTQVSALPASDLPKSNLSASPLTAAAFTPSPMFATQPPGTCQTAVPAQARRHLAWTEHGNSGKILATRLTSTCEMMLQLLTNAQPHWRGPRRAATLTRSPAVFFLSSLQAVLLVRHDSRMHATDHTAASLQSEKCKGSGVLDRMIVRAFGRRSWHTFAVAHWGTHLA